MSLTTLDVSGQRTVEMVPECPVCQTPALFADLHHRFGPYRLVVCPHPECGAEYLAVRAPREELEAQYSSPSYYSCADGEHGYFAYASEQRAIMRTVRRRLERAAPFIRGDRLLDIGGALGYGVLQAQRMGYKAEMVEISAEGRRSAESMGISTYHPTELYAVSEASYDVVMAWDTLEHIYDLPETIGQVHRVLSPGGAFIFGMPYTHSRTARLFGRHWWGYREPEHVIYLTPGSVDLLLGDRFDVVATSRDPQDITLGGAALRAGRLLPRWLAPTLGRASYLALCLLRLDQSMVLVPHGNRMYIAIRK